MSEPVRTGSNSNARYPIPAAPVTTERILRRSRFIGYCAHADSAATARALVETIRSRHTDATHHCWAYQAGPPGDTRMIGCSDDGEPHGTAGRPILNVLLHADLGELVVVVTRYFGGVKLGTGGLARAYADTTSALLKILPSAEKINYTHCHFEVDYELWAQTELLLNNYRAESIQADFNVRIRVDCMLDKHIISTVSDRLQNLSRGRILLRPVLTEPRLPDTPDQP